MQMHRALRRKLKSIKAKRLRPLLPLHLRNLMKLNMPLQTMWRDGFTEPAICEALEGLNQINSMIAKAKALLIKFENGEALTQEEEDEALKLLEKAIVGGQVGPLGAQELHALLQAPPVFVHHVGDHTKATPRYAIQGMTEHCLARIQRLVYEGNYLHHHHTVCVKYLKVRSVQPRIS